MTWNLIQCVLIAKITDKYNFLSQIPRFLSSPALLAQLLWVLIFCEFPSFAETIESNFNCQIMHTNIYIFKYIFKIRLITSLCIKALIHWTDGSAQNIHSYLQIKRLLFHHPHLVEVRELLVTQQSLFGGELPSTQQTNHLYPVCYFSLFGYCSIWAALHFFTFSIVSSNQSTLEYENG